MRTHRWPYGPSFAIIEMLPVVVVVDDCCPNEPLSIYNPVESSSVYHLVYHLVYTHIQLIYNYRTSFYYIQVLLFVDEPKLHVSRLHRVFRNLCYHVPTRAWLVRSLLSILQRTQEMQQLGQVRRRRRRRL